MYHDRNSFKVLKHSEKRIMGFHTPKCLFPKPLRPLWQLLRALGAQSWAEIPSSVGTSLWDSRYQESCFLCGDHLRGG